MITGKNPGSPLGTELSCPSWPCILRLAGCCRHSWVLLGCLGMHSLPWDRGCPVWKQCKAGGWISFASVPPPTHPGHATSSPSPSHTQGALGRLCVAHSADFICCLVFFLDFSGIFWVIKALSSALGEVCPSCAVSVSLLSPKGSWSCVLPALWETAWTSQGFQSEILDAERAREEQSRL